MDHKRRLNSTEDVFKLDNFKEMNMKESLNIVHEFMPEKVRQLSVYFEEEKWTESRDYEAFFDGHVGHVAARAVDRYQYVSKFQSLLEKIHSSFKREINEWFEILEKIKLFIELNIPRVEDGNNFGVSVQEDTVAELGRIEETLVHMNDNIFKYYSSRAKLISKVGKHAEVDDYKISVVELDLKHMMLMKIQFMGVRNAYAYLNDMLVKNMEKLLRPRSQNSSGMY